MSNPILVPRVPSYMMSWFVTCSYGLSKYPAAAETAVSTVSRDRCVDLENKLGISMVWVAGPEC
jgi:hypothetical protein